MGASAGPSPASCQLGFRHSGASEQEAAGQQGGGSCLDLLCVAGGSTAEAGVPHGWKP